ncbi:hypothetical protein DWB85_13900 [Seongchinamella sediminis]|uniref:Uncharacterized protein n=1 Tax=Seongchinamella sediminis TaxID=2283635 RepID=A0A3L7DV47_9GAMM|nr:hypothetical protein [Seongchinamella sediminis]RLQ21174.1 hypothetical protein DWB85_13900 [Seongchinamella sediminis]
MSNDPNTSPSGLYAFAECEAVDMQNGGVLLIDKFSDAQLMVGGPVAASMPLCRVFRTLEQHAQVLTASIPELAGQQADVMKVLNMLKDAGLMTTAESVCDRLNAEVPPPLDLPPTRVFAITCDRPAAVKRLLESMLRAGNLSRHEALFLIDDSRDPANAEQNREAVEEFNLTCPRNMLYFGATESAQFMAELIAQQPAEEEAIRFLIDQDRWAGEKTYGRARNLTLLLSVGCRAIVMDDDVICAAVESPHKKPGLQFGQLEREADFYLDQQDMLARTTRAEFDPLTQHASCLGLSMGQAIAKLADGQPVKPTDLAGANSAYLSLWSADSPVMVTQSGAMGDPGTPGTEWILTLDPASSKRLTEFSGGIEGALASRTYWLGQPRPTFTKMSVISQVSGLDNTHLLPPYFPVFRGEDYLFGAMTEFLHPHAAVLEYDWNVPHLPLEPRHGNPNPPPQSGRGKININKYVTDHTAYQAGVSAETRLQALAALAAKLSEMSDRDLISLFRREVAYWQAADLSRLARFLNDGSIRAPLWQQWLQESLDTIAAATQVPARVADMSSLPDGMSEGQALNALRELCAGYAASLSSWQEIRAAAGECSRQALGQAIKGSR